MFKKFKRVIISLIIILFFFGAHSALALEIKYPSLPMIGSPENCTGSGCLPLFVSYWFTLAIIAACILALISFTVGAIGLINPNPDSHNNAKDRMKGSILGLVLCLSALILLQTINPNIVGLQLTPLPGAPGIYYAKGSELTAVAFSVNDFTNSQARQDGYNAIKYKCSAEGGGTGPNLLIWKFPNPGLEGNNDLNSVTMAVKSCGQSEPLGGVGSFKMAFEAPGVYYYANTGCSGYMSYANTSTQNSISAPFIGVIKSVKIVNDPENNDYYGAIFHGVPDASKGSDCTNPIFTADGGCKNLSDYLLSPNFGAFSANIFKWAKNKSSSSGDGVWFYSDSNGWDSGNKSGVFYINSQNIGTYASQKAADLKFNYAGVDSAQAITCTSYPSCRDIDWENNEYPDCCGCSSPKDWSAGEGNKCAGSIKFGGNGYLVSLYITYSDIDGNDRLFCQTFEKDTPNLSTAWSASPGGAELDHIDIIPIVQ